MSARVWRAPFALALALALIGSGCGKRTEKGAEERSEEHAGEGHEEHRDEQAAVELTPSAVRNGGIRIGVAGPAAILLGTDAPGEIHLNAERVLEVRPRFAGILQTISKRVGDFVRKGEVVAVVQSNESLADYDISSSIAGTVIARHVVPGQAVDHETVLLTIADLSSVWAEFAIYPDFAGRIRPGMRASVSVQNRPDLRASGTIRYVGPLLEQDTRISSGRIVLPNADRKWQPGMFVTVRVVLEQAKVPVAVPDEAIVRTAEGQAVFRAEGLRFELRPVRIGRSDGWTTEVVEGLSAGDSLAIAGAFVLKSELGKGQVEHEH